MTAPGPISRKGWFGMRSSHAIRRNPITTSATACVNERGLRPERSTFSSGGSELGCQLSVNPEIGVHFPGYREEMNSKAAKTSVTHAANVMRTLGIRISESATLAALGEVNGITATTMME